MFELLVPAGSPEAVTAAVQSGADAVYLSFDELTACRQAVNFSDSAFEASVRYCRVRSCRVYLAMNAPIREDELQKAAGLALRAQRAGVDAIIVRDMGLFHILRSLLPEMPLFADQSMGFYTPESAVLAERLGFKRIFLPAELPMTELRRMAKTPIETAVFVQSSLCASVAGQCRMSVFAGQESAERGLCSAPCRESYSLGGRWDTTPLSFRDRCLLAEIPALKEAGVACICLGGRERRPEYVAAYTKVLRRAADNGEQPALPDREEMERAFCRYGVAKKDIFECADQPEAADRRREKYCTAIREGYSRGEERRVDVEFAVMARKETEHVYLAAQDKEGHKAAMEGPHASPAGELAITEDGLRDAMYRTSGTPYRCTELHVLAKEGLRLSAPELDAARRRLLYNLSEERAKVPERKEGLFPEARRSPHITALPGVNFSFQSAEQMLPELAELKPLGVYAPLELLAAKPECVKPFKDNGAIPAAILPAAVSGAREEEDLRSLLRKVKEAGIEWVLTGSPGLAVIAGQEGMKVRGDMELALTNSYALEAMAALGFRSVTISPELTMQRIRNMRKPMDTELVAYGRIPVMVTPTCLLKASAGRCTCTTPGQMADTHGGVWPVTRHFGCRNIVWSSRKLWLADKNAEWADAGLWAIRLSFSTESPRECLEVAKSYMQGTGYHPNGMTRGAYYRGLL